MSFHFDYIQDKVEFFEGVSLRDIERKINEQIHHNRAILLEVHHVAHQMHVAEDGKRYYSAVVHFKQKR
ncbi:DUF2536 family protein [Bacillus lacus]|uniref:DUF2536 family protein n=1 Tax=Metabacillus lacus TaxID=1983721 RepID=A0A7X2IX97_9BACI|nr:DUF2536 family protein [Metabacillus lacus]MRX71354.1 DUF2536 family protein [Metabacillus lacus]